MRPPSSKLLLLSCVTIAALAACGGNDASTSLAQSPPPQTKLLTQVTIANSVASFTGNRSSYTVIKTSTGYTVVDNVGLDGTSVLGNLNSLAFADVTMNLLVADNAKTISPADMKLLTELYIAFFNRVPEADGLSYWIDQRRGGMTLNTIAQSFYDVAIGYSSLTGYTASMTNADFVKIVYKNVLGRADGTAPSAAEVAYWADRLAAGTDTKGSLVSTMLTSAHNYLGDPVWGWVATLLDNKVSVGTNFAVQQGLNYKSSTESILKTTAIAAAITPTSSTAATALIPANTSIVAAPTAVALANVNTQTVGSNTFSSSSKLAASWSAPTGVTVNHYRITAGEAAGGGNIVYTALASETSKTLSELKAATSYNVVVTACQDSLCTAAGAAAKVSGATSTEYWQLQGSGNTLAKLTRIVSDGTVRISATMIGSDAGTSTANRVQLYYGTRAGQQAALSTALSASAIDAALPASYLSFVSSGTTTGLITPVVPATAVETVATGQGVPLSAAMGGKVRIFFEAQGTDFKTRIYSIDSVDGYVGQDFNSGAPTTCSTFADYSAGGGCAIKLEIGLKDDPLGANAKIDNARQNKVGFPTMTDWRWNGAAGTFMVFTSGPVTGCSDVKNHGYAVWDGVSAWKVQYEANGCPKLFKSVQAAFPLHIGGVKYKLYYGDPAILTGKGSSNLPFLGPKNLIYANGALTGQTDRVDFEDWEAQSKARDVAFLWPNGDKMDATAEGYIDDYHFMTPTSNLELQVMYLAITDGWAVPMSAAALLINP